MDASEIKLSLKTVGNRTMVWDPVRKKWCLFTPEEHVRQSLIYYLSTKLAYPLSYMAVEKRVSGLTPAIRFDLLIYNPQHQPWMLVECKKPEVTLTEDTLFQLLRYQKSLQCPYWVLSNGHELMCAQAFLDGKIHWLDDLPPYGR